MEDFQKMIVKKKIKEIQKYSGEGTQLISLYLPPNADRSSVTKQLTDEISQSSNIKSQHTRKNVQAALRRITNYLRQIDFKLPKNGLVLFSGNVSENPSKIDVILLDIEPVKILTTKLYWCDSSFHTAPLEEQLEHDEVYGVIAVDKREATIALITGKTYRIISSESSAVPGKTRAGGQCLKNCVVQLSDGRLIDIEDILNITNKSIISIFKNKNFKNGVSKVNAVWTKTKNKTYKIITKNPRCVIECSGDHVFFVNSFDGIVEKKAKCLTTKDHLITPEIITVNSKIQPLKIKNNNSSLKKNINKKEQEKITLPKNIDSTFAKVIGYFIGVGHIEEKTITFFEQNEKLAKKYTKTFKSYFNLDCSYKHREPKKNYQLTITSGLLVKVIKDNFPEVRASNPRTPQKITTSKTDVVAGFLRGFYDAKGYINKQRKSVDISINNKKLAQETQQLLLRFSIISSFIENSNKANNCVFTISISEKKSLEIFKNKINFTCDEKNKTVAQIIKEKSSASCDRQMIYSREYIKKIIEENNICLENFPKAKKHLNNKQKINKNIFRELILKNIKNKKLNSALLKIYDCPILPIQIKEIQITTEKTKMIDLSVTNKNFLANGIMVHNSAARFERLREKAAESFFRRVGEKVNAAFVEEEKLKGIIVGGPGQTKHDFIDIAGLDHRIKDKVLGTVDVGYTDESGIKEILDKGSDILKDLSIVQEKNLVNKFFGEVAKNGLATYGFVDVLEAVKLAKVSTILVSETIDWTILKFRCQSCGKIIPKVVKDKDNIAKIEKEIEKNCDECKGKTELLEEAEFIDFIVDFAKPFGTGIEVVSIETQEGMQFYKAFGGIGAFLRYK